MIYLNNQLITPTFFPDGTSQVWKVPTDAFGWSGDTIRWEFESEAELIHIAQLKALVDSGTQGKERFTTLYMPYLPYARQDKNISNSTTFALNPFIWLINSLGFDRVEVNDPHNEVAASMIKNLFVTYPTEQVMALAFDLGVNLFCYPDAGARRKYGPMYNVPNVYGEKVRDQESGRITSYGLTGETIAGKKVLIVDDLCDAGSTFVMLTKCLLERGATSVCLYVSHGLFTKGTKLLFEAGIDRLFTMKGEVSRGQ